MRLDGIVDWDELVGVCEEAYRTVAPATKLNELDARRA